MQDIKYLVQKKRCDDEELRVDGGRDSNLVPEDEQQLEERKYISSENILGYFEIYYS